MEVKNSVIMSPNFIPAVEKLMRVDMPIKNCIALNEAVVKINEKLRVLDDTKKTVMERFAKKDEDGKMVTQQSEDNPNLRTPVFESSEKAMEFAKEIQEMLEEVTDIPLDEKIKVSSDTKMTTDEFLVLQDLIEVV